MKAKLIFLFFTVFSFNTHAQNWSTAWAGGVQYYREGSRIFSSQLIKADTGGGLPRFYFSPKLFSNYKQGVSPWCSILNHTSKVGQFMIEDGNGDEKFLNIFGDTMCIKTKSPLNDEWIFYTYPNGGVVKAKVVKLEFSEAVGEPDSMKWIEINYYDSTGSLAAKEYNGLQMVISKNHGWIKRFTMSEFPRFETIKITVDSLVGLTSPHRGLYINFSDAVYNYEIGDEWHFSISSTSQPNGEWIKRVVSKELFNDTVRYGFYTWFRPKHSDTVEFNTNYQILKVDGAPSTIPVWGVTVANFADSLFREFWGTSSSLTGSDSCLYPSSSGPGWFSDHYIFGVDRYYSYSSMGGVQWNNKTITYIKKGNKIWGTPFNFGSLGIDATVGSSSMAVYPNPATDRIFLDKKGDYFIADIAGKKLIEAKGVVSIDITKLPMGIYFIWNTSGGRVKIVKM